MVKHSLFLLLLLLVFLIAYNVQILSTADGARHGLFLKGSSARKNVETGDFTLKPTEEIVGVLLLPDYPQDSVKFLNNFGNIEDGCFGKDCQDEDGKELETCNEISKKIPGCKCTSKVFGTSFVTLPAKHFCVIDKEEQDVSSGNDTTNTNEEEEEEINENESSTVNDESATTIGIGDGDGDGDASDTSDSTVTEKLEYIPDELPEVDQK